MEDYWSKIKPELIKLGFDIDDDFLSKLASKDKEYIKSKIIKSPTLFYEFDNDMNLTKNIIIKKCDKSGEVIKKFIGDTPLGRGSYNQVYSALDTSTGRSYAYRFALNKLGKVDELIDVYIETFIQSFFSIYQKLYLQNDKMDLENNWGINNILRIKHFGYDTHNTTISTLTDKMDGTLYDVLSISGMAHPPKIQMLIKCLTQMTCLIEHLQEKFKFVHNDFKANNLFYKIIDESKSDKFTADNLHFFIADFGASRFEINGHVIFGNTGLSKDTSFNPRKDLNLLINSLYYSLNDAMWVFSFFGRFTLNPAIPRNQTEFTKLYYLGTADILDIYEPKNFKLFLTTHFRAVFKCLEELGLNDDVVLTFFGAKYKIHYKK